MTNDQVALLQFIIITWLLGRRMIIKYKRIPKWLDISITVIIVIFTLLAAYDTFIN